MAKHKLARHGPTTTKSGRRIPESSKHPGHRRKKAAEGLVRLRLHMIHMIVISFGVGDANDDDDDHEAR